GDQLAVGRPSGPSDEDTASAGTERTLARPVGGDRGKPLALSREDGEHEPSPVRRPVWIAAVREHPQPARGGLENGDLSVPCEGDASAVRRPGRLFILRETVGQQSPCAAVDLEGDEAVVRAVAREP